jgi:hypothetical protein
MRRDLRAATPARNVTDYLACRLHISDRRGPNRRSRQSVALQIARIAVSKTRTTRQAFPRWEITQAGLDTGTEARSAKVIPFPGAAARKGPVVTYPAQIVLPARREIDPVPETTPRDRRIGFGVAAGLAAVAMLLLLV